MSIVNNILVELRTSMAQMLVLTTLNYNNFILFLTVKKTQCKLAEKDYIMQRVVSEG